MKDIIINLQKYDTWKIQLTIPINVISSRDNDEERVMHSKSDYIKFMIHDNARFVDELFHFTLSRYQIGLKISMRGSNFTLDPV